MVFYLCSRLSPSAVVDGYHPSGVPENERVTLSPSGYRAFLQFQDGFHMELLKAVMPFKAPSSSCDGLACSNALSAYAYERLAWMLNPRNDLFTKPDVATRNLRNVCSECLAVYDTREASVRSRLWGQLPVLCGMKGWQQQT